MKLVIDISQEPKLILEDKGQVKSTDSWPLLNQLAETLLIHIDKLLQKSKIKLEDIEQIEVIPSPISQASTKIAEATAKALKLRIKK
jgi:tRNA A37 threonylcarbamoyladenosine modification protein TsaB